MGAEEEANLVAFKISTEVRWTDKVVCLIPRGDVGFDELLQLIDNPIGTEEVVETRMADDSVYVGVGSVLEQREWLMDAASVVDE